MLNLKRCDVGVNRKLSLLLLPAIHSLGFDPDRLLFILEQTCHFSFLLVAGTADFEGKIFSRIV